MRLVGRQHARHAILGGLYRAGRPRSRPRHRHAPLLEQLLEGFYRCQSNRLGVPCHVPVVPQVAAREARVVSHGCCEGETAKRLSRTWHSLHVILGLLIAPKIRTRHSPTAPDEPLQVGDEVGAAQKLGTPKHDRHVS